MGSFLGFRPSRGAFEANPPFVPALVVAMAGHMRALLEAAERGGRPLLFALCVGASSAMKRDAAWAALQDLASGAFGRAQWSVQLQHHGYTEGHQHISKGSAQEAARMSSCDSSIFIFATTAAARRWPVTPEKEAALRAAMSHTIPRNFKRASQGKAS